MSESRRYPSIDLLRGSALVTMLLVSSRSPVAQLRHGPWFGVTVADLVYPCFLLLIGISMAISVDRGIARGVTLPQCALKMLRRCIALFVVGIVLDSLSAKELRVGLGTLQSIAIASAVAFPSALTNWRGRLAFLGAGLLASTMLLHFGAMSPQQAWLPGVNFAERVDKLLLGKYRGVEGVLGSIFSGSFVVLGLVLGEWLQKDRGANWLWRSLLLATCCLAIGETLGHSHAGELLPLPSVARLVSASFVLKSGSLLVALTALIVFTVESRRPPRLLTPILWVGGNPLAIFCGVLLFQGLVLRATHGSPPTQLAETLRTLVGRGFGSELAALTVPMIKLTVAFGLAWLLARSRIRIKL